MLQRNMTRTSVFCACGAQWHNHVIERAADIVRAHVARWPTKQAGCGPISHEAYQREYRCLCDACAAERMVRRKLKRGNRSGVPIVRQR